MRLGFAVLTALTVATPALAQPRALAIDDLRQTMVDDTLETLLEPRPAPATTDSGQGRR
jgi:hypothetical protein